jgi:hypothetical protein
MTLLSPILGNPEADFEAMYNLRKRTEQNISGTVSVKNS